MKKINELSVNKLINYRRAAKADAEHEYDLAGKVHGIKAKVAHIEKRANRLKGIDAANFRLVKKSPNDADSYMRKNSKNSDFDKMSFFKLGRIKLNPDFIKNNFNEEAEMSNDLLHNIQSDNANEVVDNLSQTLSMKAMEALANRRAEVAEAMFGLNTEGIMKPAAHKYTGNSGSPGSGESAASSVPNKTSAVLHTPPHKIPGFKGQLAWAMKNPGAQEVLTKVAARKKFGLNTEGIMKPAAHKFTGSSGEPGSSLSWGGKLKKQDSRWQVDDKNKTAFMQIGKTSNKTNAVLHSMPHKQRNEEVEE